MKSSLSPILSSHSTNQSLASASSSVSPHSPHSPNSPLSQPASSSSNFASLPIEYPTGYAAIRSRQRRCSVSAESDRPTHSTYIKKRIPKSRTQIERIRSCTRSSILFSGLDDEQQGEIIDSMSEVKVSPDETIIRQGEDGDYFYIIDSGIYDVFKSDKEGNETKVFEYNDKGSFGELALMYNCPRAATVRARTMGCLWRVDRETFRHIIIQSSARKRKLFEEALESVPILANLSRQERAQVADTLETVTHKKGEYIIRQGEIGESVFFVIEGEAIATQTLVGKKEEIEVGRMGPGSYFGERSLMTREPRAANVIAATDIKLAEMDSAAFERLLGSLRDIMQRQIKEYKNAKDIVVSDVLEEKRAVSI